MIYNTKKQLPTASHDHDQELSQPKIDQVLLPVHCDKRKMVNLADDLDTMRNQILPSSALEPKKAVVQFSLLKLFHQD